MDAFLSICYHFEQAGRHGDGLNSDENKDIASCTSNKALSVKELCLPQRTSFSIVFVLDNQICLMMRNNRTMTTVSELKVGHRSATEFIAPNFYP